ncbi:MAG TPA: polysaccharide deacetylase family protein [Gallionella sp.]|nr:polysaccharide deacetylase family protein [Gallionella sp.]
MKNCLKTSIAPKGDSKASVLHWFTTPALKISAMVHIGSALLAILNPSFWQWALGAILLNYLCLSAGVLWPKSRLLGPNMTHLPAIARHRREITITFDDGPDPEITPLVLDLLDQYGAKASFFCIANKVSAYPDLAREIIMRGHSLENHTNSHPYAFAFFGPSGILREIESAQATIGAITGVAPRFFRAPMGFRPPFLAPVVEQTGLCCATWTRRGFDTFARHSGPVLQKLLHNLAAGDILLLHDGRPNRPNNNTQVILEVLPLLLKHLQTLDLKSVSLTTACNQAPDINAP